jgi:hypothetical protein
MTKDYKGKSIVESSASVVGGVTGSLVGTWLVGPGAGTFAGAVAGTTIGEVVKRGIGEFANRFLSTREQLRVESTAKHAIIKIKQLRDEGRIPRNDGFFQQDETNRSSADELFEGVLLKAKNESAEIKIKFLGNLFANVVFSPDVPITVANFLLSTTEAASYRQFCFIALIYQKGVLNIEALRRREHTNPDLQILRREEWTLHAPSFGTFGLIDGSNEWEDWLSDLGEKFYELLGLNEIPQEDIDELSRLMSICDSSPPPLEHPDNIKRAPESKRKQSGR